MTMNMLPSSITAECLTFLHGICYQELPYFPLNQDPHRNLEKEIHDEMKDTCEKKYAKSVNRVRHRPMHLLTPQLKSGIVGLLVENYFTRYYHREK